MRKGIVNDRILLRRGFAHLSIESPAVVDCAYIITLGDTPHLCQQVERASLVSRRVVVLYTPGHEPDEPRGPAEFIPFESSLHSELLLRQSSANPTVEWTKSFDIPSKRNFAIQHARSNGYEFILLLDDDIIFRRSFVSTAIHLLEHGTDIACGYALYYPDISTLERYHALASARAPEVTIGASAVILRVSSRLAFFPYVYNEDWLFLWASIAYGGAVLTPFQTVAQRPPRRGRDNFVEAEQFGELVAFLLFAHEPSRVHRDLPLLGETGFAESGMAAYRKIVSEMLCLTHAATAARRALTALDRITAESVRSFAAALASEIKDHYGQLRS